MSERSRDERLCSVDFLLCDVAKHCFQLAHEVLWRERPNSELLFRIDFVEGDGSKTSANCCVNICFHKLLLVEVAVGDVVNAYAASCCIGRVSIRH